MYGLLIGAISIIKPGWIRPSRLHSFPSTLKNDSISGDYGSGFYLYAVNSSTFIGEHPEFGWLSFRGNLEDNKNKISVELTTVARSRVFIAPLQLWLILDTAIAKGKYENTYAKTNIWEYWSEGVQNWFNVNAEVEIPDDKHN